MRGEKTEKSTVEQQLTSDTMLGRKFNATAIELRRDLCPSVDNQWFLEGVDTNWSDTRLTLRFPGDDNAYKDLNVGSGPDEVSISVQFSEGSWQRTDSADRGKLTYFYDLQTKKNDRSISL